jgi:hypothetical protein
MSGSRSDRPAVPDFHPEFGLLCPSPRRRRGIRIALLSFVALVAIGATIGLAGAHWTDGKRPASPAQPTDGLPSAGVSVAGADTTPAHESCRAEGVRDLAAFFVNSACGSNKPHARHGGRATNRVASVILGRTAVAPATMEATPVAGAAIVPPQVDVGNAEKSANSTTVAVERTAPPKKPKAKANAPIALTPPAHEWGRQDAMLSAYAATPRFGRESYDPYGNPFRPTLQPGFAASFGRAW